MRSPRNESPSPSNPPIAASSIPSTSSCRTMRHLVAPIDTLIAISRDRCTDRARSRLATFEQAINTSNPPTLMKAIQTASVIRPLNCWLTGLAMSSTPLFVSGVRCAIRVARAFSSSFTCETPRPAFMLLMRPIGRSSLPSRIASGVCASGSHTSVLPGKRNASGLTPTTVADTPLTLITRPRIDGSEP